MLTFSWSITSIRIPFLDGNLYCRHFGDLEIEIYRSVELYYIGSDYRLVT
jgi:hypothetical protein